MRLWHQLLLPVLPRQQLLGQHRECCALRGNGWGRKHSTVDYVFTHSPLYLVAYHILVMDEMSRRGYKADQRWAGWRYRGLSCNPMPDGLWTESIDNPVESSALSGLIYTKGVVYPEHTYEYFQECVDNLKVKGHLHGYTPK